MEKEHETFSRLLEAAKKLRRWNDLLSLKQGLAFNGLAYSDARVGNWRTRGVSKDAILDVSAAIGCRPQWLLYGLGTMKDYGLSKDFDGDISIIVSGFPLLDIGTRRSWLLTAKDVIDQAGYKGRSA